MAGAARFASTVEFGGSAASNPQTQVQALVIMPDSGLADFVARSTPPTPQGSDPCHVRSFRITLASASSESRVFRRVLNRARHVSKPPVSVA